MGAYAKIKNAHIHARARAHTHTQIDGEAIVNDMMWEAGRFRGEILYERLGKNIENRERAVKKNVTPVVVKPEIDYSAALTGNGFVREICNVLSETCARAELAEVRRRKSCVKEATERSQVVSEVMEDLVCQVRLTSLTKQILYFMIS